MLFHRTSFIGIDPTAGLRPFAYAALDHELRLLALGQGDLDAVMAFVGGQEEAYVAVSAPRRPNQGLMARPDYRASLAPRPRAGRWTDHRVAEYQLGQHNIRAPRTPSDPQACPAWVQMGFEVFRRLEHLGYHPYPLGDETLKTLEVYPHASFCAWLERAPFPKHMLEGRLQRQLVLYELGVKVPDAMRFFEEITRHRLLQGVLPTEGLYAPEELDALAAAYTAWVAAQQPENITLLGDPTEGQVVVPVAELKPRY